MEVPGLMIGTGAGGIDGLCPTDENIKMKKLDIAMKFINQCQPTTRTPT